MDEKQRHRWQFGLGSLLLAITVAALVFGAIRAWDWGAPTPDWRLIKVGMLCSEVSEIIGRGHHWFVDGGFFSQTDTIVFARGGGLRIDYEDQRVVGVRLEAE